MNNNKTTITRRSFILGVALTSAGTAISLVPSLKSIANTMKFLLLLQIYGYRLIKITLSLLLIPDKKWGKAPELQCLRF
jgi:hypothetical protein